MKLKSKNYPQNQQSYNQGFGKLAIRLYNISMTNPFSFEQQPCLDFLHNDTPQSNSLLAHLMVKQEQSDENHYAINYMEGEPSNSHFQHHSKGDRFTKSKPKSKDKKKVFYRDKMAELMNEENYVKPQYNYVDFAQFQKGKSPLSRDEQLKRNRQSAKQSRQRKKQYVQTLQQKNRLHQKHINELTQRLREAQLQRDRLKESNNAHIQSFNKLKSQVYQKLSQLVQSAKTKQQRSKQIDECLNDLRETFGSAGKERVSLVNYYMSEIIENLLTDFQKYFINCAIANTGIFIDDTRNDVGKIDLEVSAMLGLNDLKKKNSLVSKFKDRFKKQALLFNSVCQQLYQSFSSLINQSSILENIFNDMRKEFDSEEVARLILYFEENKFRKDMRKMRNEWYDNFRRNEQEVTDSIRKMTKRFQY